MDIQEEIKKLKRKRDSLRTKIGEWRDRGKNAYEFTLEYKELTESLQKLGCNVESRAEWLQPEFWQKDIKIKKKKQKTEHPKKPDPPTPKNNIYILSLAWMESSLKNQQNFNGTINKVTEYLDTLGLKKVEEDFNEISNTIEKIVKYEFEGNDQSFQIVKLGTTYLLDMIAKNEYEKINIAIYGKKRNY